MITWGASFGVRVAVLSTALVSAAAPAAPLPTHRPVRLAAAEPYPPYPPPRRPPAVQPPPPPVVMAPPPVTAPPPLPPLTRALYAPFWAAGLIVRYGVYYVVVAPLEVFARALSYGPEGGVDRPQDDGR
jgi:hypothetical protein